MAKFYNIYGDLKQINFCIELYFIGHSSTNTALDFNEFLKNKQNEEFKNLLENNENKIEGNLMEKRIIKWLELIPKPTLTEEGLNDKNKEKVIEENLIIEPSSYNNNNRIFTIVDFNNNILNVEDRKKTKWEKQLLNEKSICLANSDKKNKNSILKFSEQKMKIMAYLGQLSEQNYNLNDEYLLFELILLNNNLLKIKPEGIDFNQKNIINTKNGTFFAKILINDFIKDFDKLIEEEKEENKEEEEEENDFFEIPENEEEYWLHYFIEIARARNFSDSNLRIEWFIQLPLNTEIKPLEIIEGISHLCEAKADGNEDIFHFGQLLQFSIKYKKQKIINDNYCPNILFKLTSEDCWNRIYLNGFSSLQLPINPEINNKYFKIQCWKPSINFESKLTQLKHLHLGDFNYSFYKNWQALFNQKINLSLKTENSGYLDLIINCTHQSNNFISSSILTSMRYSKIIIKKSGYFNYYLINLFKKRLGYGLHLKITKVLEEFEKAKSQLIAFRERKKKQQKNLKK